MHFAPQEMIHMRSGEATIRNAVGLVLRQNRQCVVTVRHRYLHRRWSRFAERGAITARTTDIYPSCGL